MQRGDTAYAKFSIFFEKALVSRVNRRIPIRVDKFCRSTSDVDALARLGLPCTTRRSLRRHR
jgi:hypothetical protein